MRPDQPHDSDDRAPFAKAFHLASRIMSAGITMGLLAAGGFWLDRWLGWQGPFLIAGVMLGTCAFGWQMYFLVRDVSRKQ